LLRELLRRCVEADAMRTRWGEGVGRLDYTGLAAALLCASAGLALAILPHLLWWRSLGEPVWIADNDDMYYLALGGKAYLGHPGRLVDPVPLREGPVPHRRLLFVPGVIMARALGSGPLGVNLAWRIGAGLAVGLTCYWALRARVEAAWIAASFAVLMLADTGLIECRPLVRQLDFAARLLTGQPGSLLRTKPLLQPSWRVVTPAASMAYLWLYLGLLLRARNDPSAGRLAASGFGFGLLFHVYFYYWTAASVGLGLGFLLDAGFRRAYLHSAWIGGLIGLPAVVGDVLARRASGSDWLNRTDKFLPIGHFDELLIARGSIVLAAFALVWIWRTRRDLLPVWALAAAGLGLANHQILTGLQIENFHWNSYVGNPVLELLLVLLAVGWAVPRLPQTRRWAWAFGAVTATYLALGLWLRGVEAVRTEGSLSLIDAYRAYRAGQEAPGAKGLVPRALLAGDPVFTSFALVLEQQRPLDGPAVLMSPSIRDNEWNERAALNDFLLWGDGSDAYSSRLNALQPTLAWGPWARDPATFARWTAERLALREAIASDPASALARLPVRYLALPVGRRPPARDRLGWAVLRRDARWTVWERCEPSGGARGGQG
jgi:hypothetical protein